MTLEKQALSLIERIYTAALDPPRWREFSEAMVEIHPDTAVGFALQLPGPGPSTGVYFGAGFGEGIELDGQRLEVFIRHTRRGLPWEEARRRNFVGRFGLASEVFPDEEVEGTDFYREWMKPLDLAPVAPMGHTIALAEGLPVASVAMFRKGANGAPFRPRDTELGNLLVPHLARAYAMHARVREHAALAEVLDRLPTGVMLLDASRHLVLANRAARLIFAGGDGFACDASGPSASLAGEDELLQKLIGEAIAAATDVDTAIRGRAIGSVMAISRPSGRRAYPVMVSPLLSAPAGSALRDAVAVIHISDLDAHSLAHGEVLHGLYGLTQAEIQLVTLLCDGHSLEEAAERRGVTMNTARSQLKKIFAKTGTSRQGELVRLVLAGIAPISDRG